MVMEGAALAVLEAAGAATAAIAVVDSRAMRLKRERIFEIFTENAIGKFKKRTGARQALASKGTELF